MTDIPNPLMRHQVIGARQAAELCNFSLPHFRRLYRNGVVPRPLQLGARKLGWRVADLIDWLAVKAGEGVRNVG
jgi:predicted DNA-binding transcriptional regulator AlpA